MKYSVIIPVYNAEKFLAPCIESIINNRGNLEIILVDDGSTDKSVQICDTYSDRYDFIKVYHIENGGAGNARNFGLSKSSGEYVVFVDSDDTLSPDFFEKADIFFETEKYDVVFFDAVKVFETGFKEPMAEGFIPEKITGRKKEEVLEHISVCNKFPASPWGKIIRREFLKENNIVFLRGRLSEDVDWTIRVLLCAGSFGFYEGGTYYYRYNSQSVSHNLKNKKKNVKDLIYIINLWLEEETSDDCQKYVMRFLAYEYAMIFVFLGALPAIERKPFLKEMNGLKFLLKYGKTKKLKMIYTAVKLLGVDKASFVLYRYVRERDSK